MIPKRGRNPKECERLAGDSPRGPFRSLRSFQPQNVRLNKTGGWQEFRFLLVIPIHLKTRPRSTYEDAVWIDPHEFRLFGRIH